MDNGRSIVVYDGQCAFCLRQVDRLRRWDWRGTLQFVPRDEPGLDERFPALAGEDFETGMRLIAPDGRIHAGADAVHQIACRLPAWRPLAWLYRVPGMRPLAQRMYRWIASRRYHFSSGCKDGACQLPQQPPDASDQRDR